MGEPSARAGRPIPNPLLAFMDSEDDEGEDKDSLFRSIPIDGPKASPPPPPPPPSSSSSSSSQSQQPAISAASARVSQVVGGDEALFPLLPKEDILLNIKRVACHGGPDDAGLTGVLSVTNYRAVFTSSEAIWRPKSHYEIALGCMSRIPAQRKPLEVVVHCKDFRQFLFRFETPALASKACTLLQSSAFPLSGGTGSMKWIFAFENPTAWSAIANLQDSLAGIADGTFRESTVNADFALIPTYPSHIVVPKAVTDALLREVVGFRSKGRIPALRWHDAQGKGGSLWRCSQPKSGVASTCPEDEAFFEAIRRSTPSGLNLIIDCRPFSSAVGNRAMGMGYEDVSRYRGTSIRFENIANIHAVRTSHVALGKLVVKRFASDEEAHENWMGQVEATLWLNHLRTILSASIKLAHTVHATGTAAIVHCSDGWDRTAQVVSLAKLLLASETRTVRGFCHLVLSEWILFGHRFRDRLGVGSAEVDDEERSPVFLQFLDCVYQLHRQYPSYFAFNTALLDVIVYHLTSCRFGDFLGNNAQEFEANASKSSSLFEYILSCEGDFVNALCVLEVANKRLLPHHSVVCRRLVLWDALLVGASVPSHPLHGWNPVPLPNDADSGLAKAQERVRELEALLAAAKAAHSSPPLPSASPGPASEKRE